MKGNVYLGDSKVEVRDFPKPTPAPNEVVVEMKVSGLCGSDLHKYHKDRAWAAERHGMISGHEPCGVVAELGAGVDNVKVGDRVCVYHSLGCGHCRHCLAGTPVFCEHEGAFGRTRDGSHADFLAAPARFCLPLPEELSFAVGTQLACTAGTAFAALRKAPLRHGDVLAVFGLGPVGLSALLMGQAAGCQGIGIDVSDYRLEWAKSVGAQHVIDGKTTDAVEAIMDLTHGQGAHGVLECSGSAKARSQTVEAAAWHGTVVIVGAGHDDCNLAPLTMIRKELVVRGNSVYSVGQYFEAVDFLLAHEVDLDKLVTHRFRIEQAVDAFELFDTGNTGKVVFEWE